MSVACACGPSMANLTRRPVLAVTKTEKEWWTLASNTPCSNSPADKAARWKMFRNMDTNGNGYLSIVEIERFMRKSLGDKIFGDINPSVKAAFENAKALRATRSKDANNLVDVKEFVQFLADLKQYFFEMFVDAHGRVGDGIMDYREFKQFVKWLTVWGVDVDPIAAYKSIDGKRDPDYRQTGTLTWKEIATWLWCIEKDYQLIDDVSSIDADTLGADGLRMSDDGTIVFDDESPDDDLMSGPDLPLLISMLPTSKYATEHIEARKRLWNSFDANGNGGLSCAEIENGIFRLMKTSGRDVTSALAPAITRAFHAARDAVDGDPKYVTRGEEFRLLLVYLVRYFELLVAFNRIDTNDDRRIGRAEFERALPLLASWGVGVHDPEAEFAKIDVDGGGLILFDEFSLWAARQRLDLDPTDDIPAEGEVAGRHKLSSDVAAEAVVDTAARQVAMEERATAMREQGGGDATSGIDLQRLIDMLPVSNIEGDVKKRAQMFSSADTSGNGTLTVAEVQSGLITFLGLGAHAAVRAFAPAIAKAFVAAKDSDLRTQGRAAETVSLDEFATLLVCLRRYAELLVAFDRIDTNDDHRITRKEFDIALPLLAEWGVAVANPEREFRSIDKDGSGKVVYDEFAGWQGSVARTGASPHPLRMI